MSEAVRPSWAYGRVMNRVQTIALWIGAVSLAALAVFSALNYFAASCSR